MELQNLDNVLILVGKNSTGKTTILDAVRAVGGDYKITRKDFRENTPDIEIEIHLEIAEKDLEYFYCQGKISEKKDYKEWKKDFPLKYWDEIETVRHLYNPKTEKFITVIKEQIHEYQGKTKTSAYR